ncbi:MAG TPA: hypothetical protein VM241_01955 [Candidatus Thermoplasmatota archaeon]|nr:hypothetical protein [Candidatus Thermoplasmatota archaeon]
MHRPLLARKLVFGQLRRPVAITQVMLRVPSAIPGHGLWEGPMGEAQAQRLLRALPRPGLVWAWLALEDGTEALATAEWRPGQVADLRRLAGQSLARMAGSVVLPAAACEEAHRVLELLEGRSLPCLDGAPAHLRVPAPPAGLPAAPCRRCGLKVRRAQDGHALRHFLADGSLCAHGRRPTAPPAPPLPFLPLDCAAAA